MMTKLAIYVLPFLLGAGAVLAIAWSEEEASISYKEHTLEEWVASLKSPDLETRRNAATMIAEIGPAAKNAVPDLVDALKDQDQIVRCVAAQALGNIGSEAKDAVKPMRDAMLRGDKPFYQFCVQSIRKIEGRRSDGIVPMSGPDSPL